MLWVIQGIFLILKITNLINWRWRYVLIPLWIYILIILLFLIFFFIVIGIYFKGNFDNESLKKIIKNIQNEENKHKRVKTNVSKRSK